MENYLERFIKEPAHIDNELYIYDYCTIKNFQKSSGLQDFTTVLYLALIAEIVFLFFSLHYNEEFNNSELIKILLPLGNDIGLSINVMLKIYYLPIALTIAFIIWRAKNYLLYELSLDIETKLDKVFNLLLPISFSIIVYYIFNVHYYKFWFLLCSLCFLCTSVVSYIKYISIKNENKYRIALPRRKVDKNKPYYNENNKYGFRNQVYRWSNLLLMWFSLTVFGGWGLYSLNFLLITSDGVTTDNNIILLIIINYLYSIITCFVIHYFTYLSKSVQPVCIEAYEIEIEKVINSMGYSEKNPMPIKKWSLLKLQYRALQHLKKRDVKNEELFPWFDKIDNLIHEAK